MRVIIYTLNGHLAVVRPTSPAEEERAWAQLPPQAINPRWAEDTDEIPSDRTFRGAWKDTGVVSVDMPKAREIHREKLRELRAPKLVALDIEYMRADERADSAEKSRIALKKQALRDVTEDPRIESASTPDELKAVLPEVLV
jgi:hypothetical protein